MSTATDTPAVTLPGWAVGRGRELLADFDAAFKMSALDSTRDGRVMTAALYLAAWLEVHLNDDSPDRPAG